MLIGRRGLLVLVKLAGIAAVLAVALVVWMFHTKNPVWRYP